MDEFFKLLSKLDAITRLAIESVINIPWCEMSYEQKQLVNYLIINKELKWENSRIIRVEININDLEER